MGSEHRNQCSNVTGILNERLKAYDLWLAFVGGNELGLGTKEIGMALKVTS